MEQLKDGHTLKWKTFHSGYLKGFSDRIRSYQGLSIQSRQKVLDSIWGWYHPPKTSETTGPMAMKFLPDVKLSVEARNQKKFLT